MNKSSDFQPNWVSVPGSTIEELLQEQRISLQIFAEKMGASLDFAQRLIYGSINITRDIAKRLEIILGGSVDFWLNRETQYREDLERLSKSYEAKSWISSLPIRDMVKRGWLPNRSDMFHACLEYFGVPSLGVWNQKYGNVLESAAFKKSETFDSHLEATAAWIRQGEIRAEAIACKEWNSDALEKTLPQIKELTKKKHPKEFIDDLTLLCADSGVAFVVVPTPNGCSASGATKFISQDKALLLVSNRYQTDDHFWFTFFHEVAHLLLHNKRLVFIEEESAEKTSDEQEKEANEFALNALISKELQERLKNLELNLRPIIKFSNDAKVSPGIVVGQLQHMKRIQFSHFNRLKQKYNWDDISKN